MSVPPLTAMLMDEDTAEMACYALSGIRSEFADDALRAMLRLVQGNSLIALINLVAERRDARSTGAMIKLANNQDVRVASASIAALGKIATNEAASALESLSKSGYATLRREVKHAILQCKQERAWKSKAK